MSSIETRLNLDSLTTLHWVGIVLALVTGIVHFVLGAMFFPQRGGIMFLLAGGGFFGAIGLLLINYRRRLLYTVGIPYTGVQIIAWYGLNRPLALADIGPAAALDKLTQLILIAVLIVLYWRDR